MMLSRCRAALQVSICNGSIFAIQNVRWMGRGPTIQGRKNAVDAKRTTANANLAREIMIISKTVGGDTSNVRLSAVINKAKAANMPKDKIEAAIKRGVDGKDDSNAEYVLYEASGPAGSALLIETLTNNKHRTAPALRHILSKYNGALGMNGSVAWMFERKGYLEIELNSGGDIKPEIDEDTLIEIALKAGAEDVVTSDDGLAQVTCDCNDLAAVRKSFAEMGLEIVNSKLIYNAKEYLNLESEQREIFDKLIDALFEDNDINQIHHNVSE
ncbi:Uncharacterized conserved protein [Plasmopara halstedii]|uniref:Uncharacterized conserved protein n=1 Tax=Plasmopara halstedii TaxID=4781 RepID=A0A0P1AUN3_PLAHL|nr:Uncharacterized conserved protein [Plasmopara halstedii]CEG45873.1 Uncharacterized conserved protein [Plasmopara halstedii]|eukprot:XP_024582242.1 Uncharacterized conserved protein [Plasmopara halstedii]